MEQNHFSREDRDLLIKLNTQVETLIADVKELKDNTAKRVDALETIKEDKTEVARLLVEANKVHADHETRLRSLESIFESFRGKYAILAVLGMAIVSIITSLIIKRL